MDDNFFLFASRFRDIHKKYKQYILLDFHNNYFKLDLDPETIGNVIEKEHIYNWISSLNIKEHIPERQILEEYFKDQLL